MENARIYPGSVVAAVSMLIVLFLINLAVTFLYSVIYVIIVLSFSIPFDVDSLFAHIEQPYNTFLFIVISYGILLFYLHRKHRRPWADIFRFTAFSPYILLPLILIILGDILIVMEVNRVINTFIPIPGSFYSELSEFFNFSFLTAIGIIIVAPVTEEIIFRGVILEGFLGRYNSAKAIIYSSVIFSLYHMNPVQFLGAFTSGILFGYLYYKTRSLIPCILAHAFNNAMAFGGIYLKHKNYDYKDIITPIHESQPLWLTLTGAALLSFGVLVLARYFNRQHAPMLSAVSGEGSSLSAR